MRLAVASLLLATSFTARAELRRVESVELGDGGGSIEIVTDEPANFTSFKLDRPTRVVVDFPETTAARADRAVDDELIRRWLVETLGDESAPVVQIVVELRENADYTLAAQGARVALRLHPATGRQLVALDGAGTPRRTVTPPPPIVLAPPPEPEPEPVVALPPPEPEPVVAAPAPPPEPDPVVAAPEPEPVVAAPPPEPEPVVAAPEPPPEPVVTAPEPEPEHEPEPVVSAPEPEPEPVVAAPRPASLDQVSFRRTREGARIVLRTSEPVRWALVEQTEGTIALELDGTLIPAAPNRLPLDARYFGTPVLRVVPSEDRARRATRVVVELGAPASWSASAEGDDILLDVEPLTNRAALAGGESW